MTSVHKTIWRSLIIIVVAVGVLFTLLGCPSAGPRVSWPTEKTRAFTEMDENYFFIYMVVLPASATAPQSKAEIMNYPNVKKRSMPLSRLRDTATGERGDPANDAKEPPKDTTGASTGDPDDTDDTPEDPKVYYADANVQLSLVGNRYVVVHPTTVNPPEDAFDGLTLFYMPGTIGLAELEAMASPSSIIKIPEKDEDDKEVRDSNGKPVYVGMKTVNVKDAFLQPGTDYVVYWMADYYSEGNERLGSIRFTTHALEKVPDATTPLPPLDPRPADLDPNEDYDKYKSRQKWGEKTWGGVDLLGSSTIYTITRIYKNGGGPLPLQNVMARVGEPAFIDFSKVYKRMENGLEQAVWYDGNSQTISIVLASEALSRKEININITAKYTTTPQFVVGILAGEDKNKAIYYDSIELYKPMMAQEKSQYAEVSANSNPPEPEAKWIGTGELRLAVTDIHATERSDAITNIFKGPPGKKTGTDGKDYFDFTAPEHAYFH